MNLYTAIMKAANHIEAHPAAFDFNQTAVPECGTPGCALGWIAHFMGSAARSIDEFANNNLPRAPHASAEGTFYDRMDEVLGDRQSAWPDNAALCAKGMRLYAEKYHGHEKPGERNFARELEQKLLTHQPQLVCHE